MPRGLGLIQNLLIDVLRAESGPVPFPTLVWAVATNDGTIDEQGDVPEETYKTIHRAAGQLARRSEPAVRTERRWLGTSASLVSRYPDRTKTGSVRAMRRRLLPHLVAFMETATPKRGHAEVEEAALQRTLSSDARSVVERAWPTAERHLLKAMPKLAGAESAQAISLLIRGRQLFVPGACESSAVPFVDAISAVTLTRDGAALAKAIESFQSAIPKPAIVAMSRAVFKNRLYTAVSLKQGKGESPHLLDAFKEYLLEREPAFVRALPGHEERLPRKDLAPWCEPPRATFSPELDALVHHDALKRFEIYHLLESARRA